MAQLAALLATSDEDFRRDLGRLVRSGSVPIGIVDDRRGPEHAEPDLAFVDLRNDSPGGLGAHRAAARRPSERGHLCRRADDRARPDPAGDARGRQRVLQLAGARGGVPGGDPAHGRSARNFTGRSTPAFADACVLRRERRRRHHDRRGERCCRTRQGIEAADAHSRPEAVLRRSGSLSRDAAAFTCSMRLTTCTGSIAISCASWWRSTNQSSRSSPDPSRPTVRLPRTAARSRNFFASSAVRTTSWWWMPATRSTPRIIGALYAADMLFVVLNPDVPSVRNAQRMIDRVRQLGVGGERVRVLLNRAGRRASRPARLKRRSGIRCTRRFRATTPPCPPRSTPACRSRWGTTRTSPHSSGNSRSRSPPPA